MPDVTRIHDLPRLNIPEELLPWAHRLVNDLFIQLLQLADAINTVSSGGGVGPTHNLLSITHPDTAVGSPIRGDLVVADASPEWTKLALGTIGKYLRSTGTDPAWATITRSDLPAEIAYEDEVNDFSLAQRFQSTLELVSSSTPADPLPGSVYMYQNKTGSTIEVRIRFEDGSECIVCTQTLTLSADELQLNWVE